MLGVPPYRARERLCLGSATLLHELFRGAVVTHRGHGLVDDRAFVEVAGHIVRGGADEFDTAGMRLVVRPGPLEGGQERVVDVDRPAR